MSDLTGLGTVPAPVTGIHVGVGPGGVPLVLRLFRPKGTRIAVLAGAPPAQLIALRVAASGGAVRIMTARPGTWSAFITPGMDVRFSPPGTERHAFVGPLLTVDDRPQEPGGLGEPGAWQCRLDLRAAWAPSDLAGLGNADIALMGATSPTMAAAAGVVFGLDRRVANELATMSQSAIAVVTRGSIRLVTLDPSPAEIAMLRRTAG